VVEGEQRQQQLEESHQQSLVQMIQDIGDVNAGNQDGNLNGSRQVLIPNQLLH